MTFGEPERGRFSALAKALAGAIVLLGLALEIHDPSYSGMIWPCTMAALVLAADERGRQTGRAAWATRAGAISLFTTFVLAISSWIAEHDDILLLTQLTTANVAMGFLLLLSGGSEGGILGRPHRIGIILALVLIVGAIAWTVDLTMALGPFAAWTRAESFLLHLQASGFAISFILLPALRPLDRGILAMLLRFSWLIPVASTLVSCVWTARSLPGDLNSVVLLTFFLALGAARALPAIALAEFSSISMPGQFASVASLAIYMLSLALFVTTSPWLPDSNLWFVFGNVILVAPLTALAGIIFRSAARPALVSDDVAAADRAF